MKFDIGETVIFSIEVKDDGTYKDPNTSMKISITGRRNIKEVDDIAMTKDATGKYHYDFQTADCARGKYTVTYKVTDGSRITIEKETFTLD